MMTNLRSLYFDVRVISRGQRKSAVASASYRSGARLKAGRAYVHSILATASYRSGEKLYDEQEQITFDYTRKENIRHTEIIAPKNAPAWVKSRQTLWNTVEALEKRKDAQLARDVIAVFPREFTHDQCKAMLKEFIDENFVSKGMVADLAMHESDASDGGKNPHVHIMLTLRDLNSDGFGKKNRDWNNQKLTTRWRKSWEDISNRHLEMAGHDVRVTLQSYKSLGIDKTPGVHLGHEQWNIEQRGNKTQKGNKNREVNHENVIQDSVKIANEVQYQIDDTWDALLEALNPPPERSAPVDQLESESVDLKDDNTSNEIPADNEVPVQTTTDDKVSSNNLLMSQVEHAENSPHGEGKRQHDLQVEAYVTSGEFERARKETGRVVNMRRYANRFVDMAKELSKKAVQQFANLMRETVRERDKDRGYER